MTTTDLLTRSLLGRARHSVASVSVAFDSPNPDAPTPNEATHDVATAPTATTVATLADPTHVAMPASTVYAAARTIGTDVATNPWLGGFGFGGGMDICPTIDGSSKRNHPGLLEGVT